MHPQYQRTPVKFHLAPPLYMLHIGGMDPPLNFSLLTCGYTCGGARTSMGVWKWNEMGSAQEVVLPLATGPSSPHGARGRRRSLLPRSPPSRGGARASGPSPRLLVLKLSTSQDDHHIYQLV